MFTQNILRNRVSKLSSRERDVLEGAVSNVQTFPAGHLVVRQGVTFTVSTLLVRGFMTCHFDAMDGRRHLVAVHVPGDFVDLHAYAMKKLDHDVGALTDVEVAVFTHASLENIQDEHPRLTRRLWFLTLLDAAKHRQWIFRLASLTAVQRIAHFLCETNARMLAIGESNGSSFKLPMTQSEIGQVCGLTNVHVNRVLRQLRELDLCSVRSSAVTVHDLQGLVAIGMFQPDYLYLDNATARRAVGGAGASDV